MLVTYQMPGPIGFHRTQNFYTSNPLPYCNHVSTFVARSRSENYLVVSRSIECCRDNFLPSPRRDLKRERGVSSQRVDQFGKYSNRRMNEQSIRKFLLCDYEAC